MPQHHNTIDFLLGKTFKKVEQVNDCEIVFSGENSPVAKLGHMQDCCEKVEIVDICGELKDLCDSPILLAESVTQCDELPEEMCESYTWTFYKFATNKGGVTVRWLGTSNGYYSESVDFLTWENGEWKYIYPF